LTELPFTDEQVSDSRESLVRTLPRGESTYLTLTQTVLGRLRQHIFDGVYPPGSRLNIADLASQFDVSPVPVREALRNLETEGLVEFRPNRAIVVRELSGAEIRELFLMRVPLETLAAVHGARHVQIQDLENLERILYDMDAAIGTDRWHVLHDSFHRALYGLAGLPRVGQLIDILRGQMRRYSMTFLSVRAHLTQAQAEHYALLEASKNQDFEKIKAIMREHLARPTQIALHTLGFTNNVSEDPFN